MQIILLNQIHIFTIAKTFKFILRAPNSENSPKVHTFVFFLEGFPTTYRKSEKNHPRETFEELIFKISDP